MKYTKAFERYWVRIEQDIDLGSEGYKLKIAVFRAWKAGIKKTKRDYGLIKSSFPRWF